ncbi:MAG: hypothetical protein H6Q68_1042 [Firmicutes bacterium]|nr:hypothetical protein [Bacillota bacterium]
MRNEKDVYSLFIPYFYYCIMSDNFLHTRGEKLKGVLNMVTGVKCTASICKLWESCEHCDAIQFEVNIDGGGKAANQSQQTNYKTFYPK